MNKTVKIKNIADVIAGQIMPRVLVQKGEEQFARAVTKVLAPGAISGGNILRDHITDAYLKKDRDEKKCTREKDVVIKLSTPYEAAYIDSGNTGLLLPSFCAAIRVKAEYDPVFLCAVLNTTYVREELINLVAGTYRPMMRLSDFRELEVPLIDEKDMRQLGEIYLLSLRKRLLLKKSEKLEAELMDGIILETIGWGATK